MRAVYRTDPSEARTGTVAALPSATGATVLSAMSSAAEPPGSPLSAAAAPAPFAARTGGNGNGNGAAGALPLPVLAAVGERLAAVASRALAAPDAAAADLARLEAFGLQLQELAHVVARAQQLRQESVDLGLALLQTVAEWSAEAARQGVELHGPACSEPVMANPAALKHLLDLMVEHALQQGRAVRMQIEPRRPTAAASAPRRRSEHEPARRARRATRWPGSCCSGSRAHSACTPNASCVPRGERVVIALPRG
ncbi:MAG: hypothetical protein U1F67_09670 [Rubrivivax sp.]